MTSDVASETTQKIAPHDTALQELAQQVLHHFAAKNLTLATAESCTGGWIGKLLTDWPGSSVVLQAALVCYSNAVKERVLHVPVEALVEHGAVSEPVVLAMAAGARMVADTHVAVSVSGIAGPGGGTADKPVGTVCFGWATSAGVEAETHCLSGDRDAVRRQAVQIVLQGLLARTHNDQVHKN